MLTILTLIVGLAVLTLGAEFLVKGSSALARRFGISPLVIGLTIVAYGTSAPELVVSVQGALAGQSDIALGNVVGSNIFNVLFILGLSALVAPLVVSSQLIRFDVPLMILASVMAFLMSLDGTISFAEGFILFSGAIAYTVFLIRKSRKEKKAVKEEFSQEFADGKKQMSLTLQLFYIVGGLACLILGANWLLNSSVTIARSLGVSELIIGLTLVAAGTSLPELATSVMASIRGERDIAVGNVVGSNIFNIFMVLGSSALVSGKGITASPAILNFDIPVMIAVAVACLPIFFAGMQISRWKGALFLGYYLAYTAYLILYSLEHDHLQTFNSIMLMFVIPLTVLTLIAITYREIKRRQN